jgi:hypothetical protein
MASTLFSVQPPATPNGRLMRRIKYIMPHTSRKVKKKICISWSVSDCEKLEKRAKIKAWPELSEEVRRAILAMVEQCWHLA